MKSNFCSLDLVMVALQAVQLKLDGIALENHLFVEEFVETPSLPSPNLGTVVLICGI